MFGKLRVHFNDALAVAFLAGILAGWYAKLLPSELNSAAVAWVALILQFYYRKRPEEQPRAEQ